MKVEDILQSCAKYVKDRKIKVPNPFMMYTERSFYVAQIRAYGCIYYYKLPTTAGGKIIAWWNNHTKEGEFNSRGFEDGTVQKKYSEAL